MEINDELKVALFNLVKLKEHKDKNGKDEFYTKYQPLMWQYAKQVLEQCGDEPLFEETATLPMQNVNGWLSLKGNEKILNEVDDCLIKFDTGEVMRYKESDWPNSIMTHFMLF